MLPAFDAPGFSCRVGERRDDVHELRLMQLDFAFQIFRVHAVRVAVHRYKPRFMRLKHLNGGQIRRLLYQNDVARVDINFRQQVDCLLRAGCKQHVVDAGMNAFARQMLGNAFP